MVCMSIYPSIRADAKYILRLAFLLMSGLFHHCGIEICFVGLEIGVEGLKKFKERSKGNLTTSILQVRLSVHWSVVLSSVYPSIFLFNPATQ